MAKKVSVGIDLGTTYSCVGVWQNGRVEIIANEQGNRTTPSWVAFTDYERLIGEGAKEQGCSNTGNTVFETKRLIGRKYNDPVVQNDMKHWPFKIIDENNSPKIQLLYKTQPKVFTPEEISSMVLTKMKDTAEAYLGCDVTDAVITVPAYFNDSQRQATKDAGEIAGLNVLKIINEPTAAAIAYGIDKQITTKRNVLVYDLGGGTFDVVILSIADGVFDVKAVGGDTHLGGGDFDNLLVQHFIEVVKRKYKKDISGNQRALGRLRAACENVKRNLSSSLKASIDIACLFDGTDFRETISRNKFEELCSGLFQKTVEHVTTVLNDAGMVNSDIQEIVLVGGSTRIPKIHQMLQEFFDGQKINQSINPDEAVAYGAAIQAACISGGITAGEILLQDVVPLSLSVNNPDGTVTTVMKKNTKIPNTNTVKRTTVHDYQKSAIFKIYEGERSLCENNNLLGAFELSNIELAMRGVPSFSLTYEVDANGILHTSAIDNKTGCANGITITSNKGRLNRQDIDRMVKEADAYNADDREQAERNEAKQNLQRFCYSHKMAAESGKARAIITMAERETLLDLLDDAIDWLDDNEEADKQLYNDKLIELKCKCSVILSKLQVQSMVLPSEK